MPLPMYQIEVRHPGLHKYRLIRGRDRRVVEEKARAQMAVWNEMWQRQVDRENARQLKQANKEWAADRTTEARQAVEEMGRILARGLAGSKAINWDALKDHSPFLKPRPGQPDRPHLRHEPKANSPEYRVPRVWLLDELFPWWRLRKVREGRARFRKALAYWDQERQELTQQYAAAVQQYRRASAQWASEEQAFRTAQAARNSDVDDQRQRYEKGEPEAVVEYCEMVLSRSEYPEGFPQQVDLEYVAECRTLIVDCEVPAVDTMPSIKEVKYVQSRNELVEVPLRSGDVEKMYDSAVYQIALRTVHELFAADTARAIGTIAFNGWLCATNEKTGHPGCWCVLSFLTGRSEFTSTNLASVDPKACFKALKGISGARLYGLTPVKPILEISREERRFVASEDVPPQDAGVNRATTATAFSRPAAGDSTGKAGPDDALARLRQDTDAPAAEPVFPGEFVGPGRDLNMGPWGVLHGPMIYMANGAARGVPEPSLLDASLPVSRTDTPANAWSLPYWPSYSDCLPEQRGLYLRWLTCGRNDPVMPIGYVFIYFYGLERRVLVDHQDHDPIIREVLRLLSIYHTSNSFRGYATDFLWTAMLLALKAGGISPETLALAVTSAPPHDDNAMATCLATFYLRKEPLPKEIAYTIAAADLKSPRSVIVRRNGQMFRKLFYEKYAAAHGQGLVLQASKRNTRIQYHAASSALGRLSLGLERLTIPSVTGMPSQFAPLVTLWTDCIEELRAFDRAHKAEGPAAAMTTAMYEALPSELRKGDHPEIDAWFKVNNDHVDDAGWAVVPASALAGIKGFPQVARLTKRQCAEILTTADVLEFGLEPDTRITGKIWPWDQKICLFLLAEEPGHESGSYSAAAAMLELGMGMALTDGTASEDEMAHMLRHLESQFELTANEKLRLRARQHLLLTGEAGDSRLGRKLQAKLSVEQRRLVGKYLFAVAAVDQVVTGDEMRALRKVYRQLGLDATELDSLVSAAGPGLHADGLVEIATGGPRAPGETIPPGPHAASAETFALDMAAVNRIMSETRQVAEILTAAMKGDGEEPAEEPVTTPQPAAVGATESPQTATAVLEQQTATPWEGLSPRFRPFLAAMSGQAAWPAADFAALARQHHLMPAGVVEAINEWSQEHLGDWVIEDGDPVRVRLDLLKEQWDA